MPRNKSRTLTNVELEFMNILWPLREASTEQVLAALHQKGRPLSDGSVRKILSILIAKGYAVRRPSGRSFLYRAQVPMENAKKSMLLDLVARAFGGSSALMVAALLDSRAIRKGDLERMKKLIAEHEKEKR